MFIIVSSLLFLILAQRRDDENDYDYPQRGPVAAVAVTDNGIRTT